MADEPAAPPPPPPAPTDDVIVHARFVPDGPDESDKAANTRLAWTVLLLMLLLLCLICIGLQYSDRRPAELPRHVYVATATDDSLLADELRKSDAQAASRRYQHAPPPPPAPPPHNRRSSFEPNPNEDRVMKARRAKAIQNRYSQLRLQGYSPADAVAMSANAGSGELGAPPQTLQTLTITIHDAPLRMTQPTNAPLHRQRSSLRRRPRRRRRPRFLLRGTRRRHRHRPTGEM